MGGLRWWLAGLQDWWRESIDGRIVAGLVAAVLLLGAGFYAAKRVGSADASSGSAVRITTRVPVTETINGHTVVRYQRKLVYAKASTSYRTQTIHTPSGTKVVTKPVVRYRVLYRKKIVTRGGHTRTVLQPVTTTTNELTNTALVTTTVVSSRTTTQTVTQPVTVTTTREVTTTVVNGTTVTVTVPVTTTVVSTETDTVPVTVTVTVPTTG